jgi:hypothetical protein
MSAMLLTPWRSACTATIAHPGEARLPVPPRPVDHHRLAGMDGVPQFSPFALAVDQLLRLFHRPAAKDYLDRSYEQFGTLERADRFVAPSRDTSDKGSPSSNPGPADTRPLANLRFTTATTCRQNVDWTLRKNLLVPDDS